MPRRAKPTAGAPRTKRERVVSAASRLFLREGYGATGMDAIAQEAGVSKATVYSYYGDKASLFEDVVGQMCEEMGGHRELDALAGGSLEQELRAIALHGIARVLETLERQIVQRVVAESREFPELGKRFWQSGPGRVERHLRRALEEARRRGTPVADPARSAARFAGQLTGLYLLPMLLGVRKRPSEAEVRRDVDVLVKGLMASLRQSA